MEPEPAPRPVDPWVPPGGAPGAEPGPAEPGAPAPPRPASPALKAAAVLALLLDLGLGLRVADRQARSGAEFLGFAMGTLTLPFLVAGLLALWRRLRTQRALCTTILVVSLLGSCSQGSNLLLGEGQAQKRRAMQDFIAIAEALKAQRPPPALPADLSVYGDYRSYVVHLHEGATQGLVLQREALALQKQLDHALAPESLADPSVRAANHVRIRRMVTCLADLRGIQDRVAGPASEALYQAMPGSASFKRGLLQGLASRRKDLLFVMGVLARKEDYYRKADHILDLADHGLVRVDATRRLLFRTAKQVEDYRRSLADLQAAEAALNRDAQRVRALFQGPGPGPETNTSG